VSQQRFNAPAGDLAIEALRDRRPTLGRGHPRRRCDELVPGRRRDALALPARRAAEARLAVAAMLIAAGAGALASALGRARAACLA